MTNGSRRVVVEADGGSRGNPGPAGFGAVVIDADTGDVLAERRDYLGIETNNVAEYRGLLAGLEAAAELRASEVTVRMDSKLVVEQMSGRWQIKHETLRRLAAQGRDAASRFDRVAYEWIPREQNRRADRLANLAMDAGTRRAGAAQLLPAEPSWTPPVGTPTRLVLVRHGATAHNREDRFSGRNDTPLDEAGRGQAAALGARLAVFGPFAAIVSSPLRRARQTADAIAGELDVTVVDDDRIAETDFGAWEQHTLDEVRAGWPRELLAWLADPNVAAPGGESVAAVERRARRARDSILTAYGAATVVVVTHVTPIKALLRMALDAGPSMMFRLHLDPASITVIDYFADGQVSVRLVNQTSSLIAQ